MEGARWGVIGHGMRQKKGRGRDLSQVTHDSVHLKVRSQRVERGGTLRQARPIKATNAPTNHQHTKQFLNVSREN